jgi:hypothetical protein
MMYHFNVTGEDRKALVNGISQILQIKAKYLGMPTAAYQIGDYTVSENGTLSTEGDTDAMERLVHNLIGDGFIPEEHEEEDEEMSVSISMPTAMFDEAAMTNLKRLVESKSELMKRAFKTSELPIEEGEERVTFPWFQADANPEEIRAYTLFIQKLCEMAIRQKRINQTKKEIVNEKYEFRCFLLRLGLIGDEFKTERKILMRHLTGSAAFKRG